MRHVVVFGGLVVEEVLHVAGLPPAGRTVAAHAYEQALAGAALRQAVLAAARGPVDVVGCVGDDDGGERLVAELAAAGASTAFVRRHATAPTGRAYLLLGDDGQRAAVTVAGANAEAAFPSAALEGAGALLAQLDVPMPLTAAALRAARGAGVPTLLAATPARRVADDVLELVDVLITAERAAGELGEVAFRGTAVLVRSGAEVVVLRPGRDDVIVELATAGAGRGTDVDRVAAMLAAGVASGQPVDAVLGLTG